MQHIWIIAIVAIALGGAITLAGAEAQTYRLPNGATITMPPIYDDPGENGPYVYRSPGGGITFNPPPVDEFAPALPTIHAPGLPPIPSPFGAPGGDDDDD